MILGVVGFIGSGKGSVGDILHTYFGFEKQAFANTLKDAVSVIFGWDRNLLEGDTKESREFRDQEDPWWKSRIPGMTPRRALQLMGTEAGRNVFDNDLWLYALERQLDLSKDYIITDVRFPNEISFVRDLGGKIVRVQRGQNPPWYDYAVEWNTRGFPVDAIEYTFHNPQVMDKYPGIHYSEFAWIGQKVDAVIDNDGNFEDLREKVKELVDKFLVS